MADQKKKRKRKRSDPNRAAAAAQREEARRRQREERRRAALAEKKKQERRAMFIRWARLSVVGIVVVGLALVVFRPSDDLEGVERVAEDPAKKLVQGATYDYGTSTPTSGWYYEDAQECGLFDEEITAEAAATAIYYGAAVLWYSPDLPAGDLANLIAVASEYDSHVVISPQEGLDHPIVATAWNRLKNYDTADGVDEFIDAYRKSAAGNGDCPTGF